MCSSASRNVAAHGIPRPIQASAESAVRVARPSSLQAETEAARTRNHAQPPRIDERAEPRFVSTGTCRRASGAGARRRGARALPREHRRERTRRSTRRSRACRATSSASASPATTADVYAVGDARRRVHDHERLEAVRLRARLRGARRRSEARRRLGVNATGLPFNSLTAIEQSPDGRTNPMVNPGAIATTSLVPGATAERKWQLIHDGLSRFAGRDARAQRRGLRLGVRDQRPQPGHRPAAPELRPDLLRPGRGDRPLHAAVLAERDRHGPGGDGRDAGRRRRQPAHAASAWSTPRRLPLHAGGDDDRRAVRDLRRLALRRRPARQERHRRRHRHRLARQGRPRHVRAAARRGRQQRQGPARGAVPLAAARARPVRLGARCSEEACSSPSSRRALLVVPCSRPSRRRAPIRGREGARRALRPGRAARRAGPGVRPWRVVRADRRRPALRRADGRAPRAVGPRRPGQDRPDGGRSRPEPLRVPPRFPRQRARPGLRLRALGTPHHRGHGARRVRTRRHRARPPGSSSRCSTGSTTSSTTGTTPTRATGR